MQRVSLSLEMRLSKLRRAWWILSYIKLQIRFRCVTRNAKLFWESVREQKFRTRRKL